MTSSLFRRAPRAVLGAALLLPALCLAHVGGDAAQHHGAAAAFAAGFAHPFTGLDHVAAMWALGVWSALTARRVWVAPLAFGVTLALGALLGAFGQADAWLPGVEPMVALSVLVLGLLLATGARLPALHGAVVAAVFALFHGAAHGQAFAGDGVLFAIGGIVLATAVLHLAGLGFGWMLKERSAWLPRAAGAAVALSGVALLGQLA